MLRTGVTSNATGVQCCVVCNKPIIKAGKRGPRPRFCAGCLAERKLEKDRRAAERQRRKRGMAHVKGAVANCDKCSRPFVRTTRTHRFCADCAPEAALEYSREYQRRKNRAKGREQVGTLKLCANSECRREFSKVKKGRQFYCAPCMDLSAGGMLPKMREWKREYRKTVLVPKYRNDPDVNAKIKRQVAATRLRRKQNPSFTINERMSAAIRLSLRGTKNGASWESLVLDIRSGT